MLSNLVSLSLVSQCAVLSWVYGLLAFDIQPLLSEISCMIYNMNHFVQNARAEIYDSLLNSQDRGLRPLNLGQATNTRRASTEARGVG